MSFDKVLSDGRCRLCQENHDLMRFFLIHGSQLPANTIPVCLGCLVGSEQRLPEEALRQEELAYLLKRRPASYLATIRIGGEWQDA